MKPIIVFELANNHNGSVARGVEVIEEFSHLADKFRAHFKFAFKLQYRDLDTYIHPTARKDIGYVKRFLDTRLTRAEFKTLVHAIRENGFLAVCTPFDEISVQHAIEDEFDYLKVASASFGDWPLLESVVAAGKPVIASTGGASVETIWKVAAFFRHRDAPLALLHCVAEYPTAPERLHLEQIANLQRMNPSLGIGFSTHEPPDNTESIGIALALGAFCIEKHVGMPPLNDYSASPEQAEKWLSAGARALDILGRDSELTTTKAEQESLASLRRGVYAKKSLKTGHVLTTPDVEFAFPAAPGQLTANEWSKYTLHELNLPLNAGEAIFRAQVDVKDMNDSLHRIARAVHEMVAKSGVVVPDSAALEVSHHYGLDNFEKTGIAMFTLVNRKIEDGGYCKKMLLLLPGQSHPEQYHNKKEETFVVLHGDMELVLDGERHIASRGDVITISPGVRHAFSTESGVVFEEISSPHEAEDSFYTDPVINGNAYRKTFITHWVNA